MGRPVTIENEDLLKAAREVFLEKGVNATTADIAKRAGVSEGTLFHRYKTKESLFRAAMVEIDPRPMLDGLGLEARVGRGELFDELVDLGSRLVDLYRIIVPGVLMMRARGAGEGDDGALPPFLRRKNAPPVLAVRALAGYFEAEMRIGRIRDTDAEILARSFIGGLWQYVFFETLGGQHSQLPLPQSMYVRGFVDMLIHGISPSKGASSGRK